MTENIRSEEGPLHAQIDDVPSGNVDKVLEWVGDDRSRAAIALAAENDRDGGSRSTLVDSLNHVLSTVQETNLTQDVVQG